MKNYLFAACAASTLCFSSAALADPTSVGTVNIQKLMKEADAAKSVRDQLEKKYKSFQSDIGKKEEQLQKTDQELGKQKAALSKEAFETKVKEFRAKVTDVQKEAQSKKAMLDSASSRAWETIQKSVVGIVGDIAKSKNIGLVLAADSPTSQVLYAENKLDITDDVLTQINKALPKLEVNFDAPKDKK